MIFNRKTNYIIPVKLRKWPLKFTHCGVHSDCVDTWDVLWRGSSSDFGGLLHLSFALVSLGNCCIGSFHKGRRRKLEVGAITMLLFPQTRHANPLRLQGGIAVLTMMSNLIAMGAGNPFSLLNSRRWGRCVFFVGVLHYDWLFLWTEWTAVRVLMNLNAHRSKYLFMG